jgi:hypothetical protein
MRDKREAAKYSQINVPIKLTKSWLKLGMPENGDDAKVACCSFGLTCSAHYTLSP